MLLLENTQQVYLITLFKLYHIEELENDASNEKTHKIIE